MTEAIERYKRNFQEEIDSAAQYRAMADAEPDEKVARIYRELGAMEEKHAHFLGRAPEEGERARPAGAT